MKCFADCSAAILIQGVITRNGNYALGETQAQTSPNSCLKGRLLSAAGYRPWHPATIPKSEGVLHPLWPEKEADSHPRRV